MRRALLLAAPFALLSAVLVACAAAPPIADPKGPYARGEQIYRSHCAACHRLRAPSSQTRERWAWAVEKYGPRARLFGDERAEVLSFLQAYAKDAPPVPPAPAASPAPEVKP